MGEGREAAVGVKMNVHCRKSLLELYRIKGEEEGLVLRALHPSSGRNGRGGRGFFRDVYRLVSGESFPKGCAPSV